MLRFGLAAVLVGLTALSSAQITKSGSGYLFRVSYKKGQVIRFFSSSTVIGATNDGRIMKLGLPVVLNVTNTKGTSSTVRLEVGPITTPDKQTVPKQTAVLDLDNRNRAIGNDAANANLGAQLPEAPMAIGATWTAVAPIATANGNQQRLDAKYKFVGFKKVTGTEVAVITYTIKGVATGSGTMMLQAKDGTLYSNTSKLTMAGVVGKLTISSSMKRK